MKIYRVGGYVRDKLLGLDPHDCDYVVVNSSVSEMLALGFQQIGSFFPVFLHPHSGEEYALARIERKQGQGHRGFAIQHQPSVTLEEDLSRRDLTINAIAEDQNQHLIDPFGGINDLKQGVLRHVSSAFVDDPLRVLRVARFAAKFNFKVAPETLALLKQMSLSQEGATISRERIVRELERALGEPYSAQFFAILANTANLAVFFPNLALALAQPTQFEHFLQDLNPPEHETLIDNPVIGPSELVNHQRIDYKFMLLAIYLCAYPDGITEVSLNKKIQKYIYKAQRLHTTLANDLSDLEYLQLIKQLDALRNFKLFKQLSTNYQAWLGGWMADHPQRLAALELLEHVTGALTIIPVQQLQERCQNRSQLAEIILSWQLTTIHNLRKQ